MTGIAYQIPKPVFDPRPRGPDDRGWELYSPLVLSKSPRSEAGEDRLIAIHESGHLIAYVEFGIPFKKAWLVWPKTGGGHVEADPNYVGGPSTPAAWEEDAIISLAGPYAQRRYSPNSRWRLGAGFDGYIHNRAIIRPGSDFDCYDKAISEIVPVGCCIAATVKKIRARTIALVRDHWAEIKLLSAALLERKTLTERQVYLLLKRPLPKRRSYAKERYQPKRQSADGAGSTRRTAYHESGHACGCIELRVPFRKVDIIKRRDNSGMVYIRKSRANLPNDRTDPRVIDSVERNIITDFAGGLAERRFAPRSNWAHAMGHDGFAQDPYYDDGPTTYHVKVAYGSDLHNINKQLKTLGRYGDAAYRAALEARAAALVRELWPGIQCVARALLKNKVLSQAEVRRLMTAAKGSTR
jgi:hypothetical protein